MNITEVRIRKTTGTTKTKAYASVTIDDAMVIHDIRVIEGRNGLFVAMPSKKVGEKYYDISHPIKSDSRSLLVDTVLSEYQMQA